MLSRGYYTLHPSDIWPVSNVLFTIHSKYGLVILFKSQNRLSHACHLFCPKNHYHNVHEKAIIE
jgi:hypothetical protein